jgi:CheY-like chemotaxis protein
MATTECNVNIILVEDDDGHAVLVEKNLRRAGLVNAFLRLKDGQEALDYFFTGEGSRADLQQVVVLLDVNMPKVTGIEVLKQLKTDVTTTSIPVIMLTTTDDPREIERCYEYGCNVYITKPVEYDDFIEAVRRLGFFLQVVKLPMNSQISQNQKGQP